MCHHVVCWLGTSVLDKTDAFIIRIDYKTTHENVVHYPIYFRLFCVLCAVVRCMV
jgi:hypothetical protein